VWDIFLANGLARIGGSLARAKRLWSYHSIYSLSCWGCTKRARLCCCDINIDPS
jgi:hypothetical protein